MRTSRRNLLKHAAAVSLTSGLLAVRAGGASAKTKQPPRLIVDTHQHLWDLQKLKPPWLARAPEILRQNYRTQEYLEATRGLNVKAIYMEVDLPSEQHRAEVEHVVGLSRGQDHPTSAAVVGGRPASPDFAQYVKWLVTMPEVKGVRQVLHGAGTRPGYCLQEGFVRGIALLGKHGLSFDLCMRPAELSEGQKLARRCPETRFIVDHCGNADPKAFRTANDQERPSHKADPWRRDMENLARLPNVICKISGIVARAPSDWQAEHLAPIVNHCLDVFGPDRVVFGSDWPVCLRGAPLRRWIEALTEIVAGRSAEQRAKLWQTNARQLYALNL